MTIKEKTDLFVRGRMYRYSSPRRYVFSSEIHCVRDGGWVPFELRVAVQDCYELFAGDGLGRSIGIVAKTEDDLVCRSPLHTGGIPFSGGDVREGGRVGRCRLPMFSYISIPENPTKRKQSRALGR